jgi:hypothetical protein
VWGCREVWSERRRCLLLQLVLLLRPWADQQDRAQQVLEESEASRIMVMCHRLAQLDRFCVGVRNTAP